MTLRCANCGRFVPYAAFITYTRYGGPEALEPPDPEFLHLACFKAMDEHDKALLDYISWIKPHPDGDDFPRDDEPPDDEPWWIDIDPPRMT